jgi:hypothetical protein
MTQLDQRTDSQQSRAVPQATPRTNRLAAWGLALAILTLGGVGSVLGIVFGAKARQQVRASGERGAGMALAAIIVGAVTLLVAIGYWILIAQHFGGSGGGGTGGGGGGY